jgi:hypothetical protein
MPEVKPVTLGNPELLMDISPFLLVPFPQKTNKKTKIINKYKKIKR